MRGHTDEARFQDRDQPGLDAIRGSLNPQHAPILNTRAVCKSGMTFVERRTAPREVGKTEPIPSWGASLRGYRSGSDDAFLIALQLTNRPDFDLYAGGRLIRPPYYDAGAVVIFDLRMHLTMERRAPFHSVDLYLPRKSLDALAQDANLRRVDELRHEPGAGVRDPVARDLLLSMRPALSAPGEASELFVDHVAMALAAHVAHTYGGMRGRPCPNIGALARWQEHRAKEMLAANLAGRITLAELAQACELSIRQFTRAFRGSTGMSPHAWLLQLRIEKAKGLLTSSRGSLSHVALVCGFADQSHLTRAFQRCAGMSPGAWRRLHRR
jgi:AraC family transcriptional regulator